MNQKGCQPLGNGDTPMTCAWPNSTTTNSSTATPMRQSSSSRQLSFARPEITAANGTLEVRGEIVPVRAHLAFALGVDGKRPEQRQHEERPEQDHRCRVAIERQMHG